LHYLIPHLHYFADQDQVPAS